ncbi:hypothetical protein MMC13_003730 [Lambiella insularis]|nr:hypothetical protein [Lambiella insularis]
MPSINSPNPLYRWTDVEEIHAIILKQYSGMNNQQITASLNHHFNTDKSVRVVSYLLRSTAGIHCPSDLARMATRDVRPSDYWVQAQQLTARSLEVSYVLYVHGLLDGGEYLRRYVAERGLPPAIERDPELRGRIEQWLSS